MKNNLPVFGIIMALLIVFRCLTEKSAYLTKTVAIINLVALLIVVFSITIQIKERLVEKIEQSGIPQEISRREKRVVQKRIDCITYIPFCIVAVTYVIFWSSGMFNDIISIVALCLSLSDTYIIEMVVSNYKL